MLGGISCVTLGLGCRGIDVLGSGLELGIHGGPATVAGHYGNFFLAIASLVALIDGKEGALRQWNE